MKNYQVNYYWSVERRCIKMEGYVVYQAKTEEEVYKIFDKYRADKKLTKKEEEIMDEVDSYQNEESAKDHIKHHGGVIIIEDFTDDLWEDLPRFNGYDHKSKKEQDKCLSS